MEISLCTHKRDQLNELRSNTLFSFLEISAGRLSGRSECQVSLFSKHISMGL